MKTEQTPFTEEDCLFFGHLKPFIIDSREMIFLLPNYCYQSQVLYLHHNIANDKLLIKETNQKSKFKIECNELCSIFMNFI